MRLVIALAAGLLLGISPSTGAESSVERSWLQWGGPGRDFRSPAGQLASSWPEGGPETLWSRPLGEGHSAVLFEKGRLYTMHRVGDDEIVICLDATNGNTLWETAYRSEYEGLRQYGTGPRSTPLIVGDLIFTVGVTGRMHALEKSDGKILWSQDLWGDQFAGQTMYVRDEGQILAVDLG